MGFAHPSTNPPIVSQSPEQSSSLGTEALREACPRSERPKLMCPLTTANWDDLVTAQRGYSFFHSVGWAEVLQATYGHATRYLVAAQDGSLAGLLPLMEVNSPITGRRGVSLPFTDTCPLLAPDAASSAQLVEEAIALGRARGWRYLECRGIEKVEDGMTSSICFYGHRVDLNPDLDGIFARLDPSVRRAIRKAGKEGVRVEVGAGPETVAAYYRLHCLTRKKHGLPPQPFRLFQQILRCSFSRQQGMIVLALWKDQPIAGALFLHLGKRAVYKYSASDSAFLQLRGNNLVMWEALKWYAEHGYDSCHLGRTSINNEGLRNYKLHLGAEEETIRYFKFDFGKNRFVVDRDLGEGWHNWFFGAMPVPVLRLLGKVLYKHLS